MTLASSRSIRTFVAILAATFGLLAMRPVSSFDFWWHLSMGRATIEAGARTFPDPVGLAAAESYTNGEWLFDVTLFGLYQIGGIALVNLLLGVLAATSFVLCWLVAWELSGRRAPWMAVVLASLVAGAAYARFLPRPQAAFLVFLPLAVLLGIRVVRRFRPSAVALVALFAVWAQTHPSIVIAPFVVLAAMLTGAAAGPAHSQGWKLIDRRHLLLLVVLAALTLTSAHGLGIVPLVLGHTENDVTRHVAEMRAFRLAELDFSRASVSLAVLLGIALLGVARHRRVTLGPVALLVLGMAMAANSVRFLGALAYLTLPLAATAWSYRRHRESGTWAVGALLVAVSVPGALAWRSGAPALAVYEPNFPVRAVEALRALDVHGPLFNTYNDGGYLGWQLYGTMRPVIDGRTQVLFDSEEFYAARVADDDKDAFDALHANHGFAAVVVSRDRPICSDLVADPAWSTVWAGERDAVFLPAARAPHDLSLLSACSRQDHPVARCRRAGDLPAVLAQVEAARHLVPSDAFLARLGAELALQCLSEPRLDLAIEYLRSAASEPEHPDFAWLTASVLQSQGQAGRALEVLREVSVFHLRGQTLRLRLLMRTGRDREAADLGRQLVDRHDDNTPDELRDLVAGACEAAADRRCAVQNALRAALRGFEPAQRRLRRYLDMGWVPPEHEKLARGAVAGSAPAVEAP